MSGDGVGEPGAAAVVLAAEVRRLRRDRGLSQPQLAQRVGYTRQYISLAERAHRNLPSAELIRALDAALGADGALIGLRGEAKSEQRTRRAKLADAPISKPTTHGSPVDDLCDLLMDYSCQPDTVPDAPLSLADLRRDLERCFDAYQQSRFSVAANRVCTLLSDTAVASREVPAAERQGVEVVRALAYQAAAAVLTKTRDLDLAWIAAERGLAAAQLAGDPVVRGSLMRSAAFAMLSCGRLEAAMRQIESAAHDMKPTLNGGDRALSVYGMLFLAGSMAAARFGDSDRTADYLREADDTARRLGRDGNELWTAFGPTNVAIHRVNTATELDDFQTVLNAQPLGNASVPLERRTRYLIDIARAQSLTGRRDEALSTLFAAERDAPEHVRQHHVARTVVAGLVKSTRGKPGVGLDRLAQRLDVAGARP